MVTICPKCKYQYTVEEDGKYECGICGKRFFLFKNGSVEPIDEQPEFEVGDVICNRFSVANKVIINDSLYYRCFDRYGNIEVYLKNIPAQVFDMPSKKCSSTRWWIFGVSAAIFLVAVTAVVTLLIKG